MPADLRVRGVGRDFGAGCQGGLGRAKGAHQVPTVARTVANNRHMTARKALAEGRVWSCLAPVGLLKRLSQVRILPGALLAISRSHQASVGGTGPLPGTESWVWKAGLICGQGQQPGTVLAGHAPWSGSGSAS